MSKPKPTTLETIVGTLKTLVFCGPSYDAHCNGYRPAFGDKALYISIIAGLALGTAGSFVAQDTFSAVGSVMGFGLGGFAYGSCTLQWGNILNKVKKNPTVIDLFN